MCQVAFRITRVENEKHFTLAAGVVVVGVVFSVGGVVVGWVEGSP